MNTESHSPSIVTLEELELPSMLRARTPKFIYRIVRVIALGLVLLIAGMLLLPWQQNVRGEGRVLAFLPSEREQSVDAPIDGRIVEWFVQEGSPVEKGDPLFRISDNDPLLVQRLNDQLQSTIGQRTAALAKANFYQSSVQDLRDAQSFVRQAADERVIQAEQKVISAEQKLEAAEAAIEIANWRYERQKQLRDEGLASVQEYEGYRLQQRKAKAEKRQAEADLEAAHADVKAKQADREGKVAELEQKIQSLQADRETAVSDAESAAQKISSYEIAIARQQTQDVTAPMTGIVYRVVASQGNQGQFVKASDPCVILVPATNSLCVELWVDGNDQPLVEQGKKVRIQFEGWPAAVFVAGWPDAAIGTFGGEVVLVDPSDDGQGRFRILVRPDIEDEDWPGDRFLRQGVQARGWVLLETVSLGYEFWRQLNGFPPNFNSRESATQTPNDATKKSSKK